MVAGVVCQSTPYLEDIAATCVDMVLERREYKVASLVCLPVSYAYGGTTKA